MKTVILLNGLPRAGKDTIADYLTNYHNFEKISFASPLKEIISNTFNISLSELDEYKNNIDNYGLELIKYDINTKNNNIISSINFRQILQNFGTEGMKPIFGNDVWSKILYENIIKSDNKLFVVPDYRFLSEYIPTPGLNIYRVLVKDERELPISGHASDIELYTNESPFDYTIDNKNTLDELYCNTEDMLCSIKYYKLNTNKEAHDVKP